MRNYICRACGHEIGKKDKVCRYCGEPGRSNLFWKLMFVLAITAMPACLAYLAVEAIHYSQKAERVTVDDDNR